MIITLKVALVSGRFFNEPWGADIEIDGAAVLDDLHGVIQRAVGFGNDHLYCFFVARHARSGQREFYDDENELMFTTSFDDLFPLPSKRTLFYLFDWGGEWVFKINRSRRRPMEPVEGVAYPQVVNETGIKPIQYPQNDEY